MTASAARPLPQGPGRGPSGAPDREVAPDCDGPGAADRRGRRALRRAYERSGGPGAGAALVAVGGYGRGELAPYSDLDVVLVHDEGVDVRAVAEQVWYPLWDSGARLDHSVRSMPEMVAAADADLKVALGLLDLRHLAGDPNLTLRLRTTMLAHWRRGSRASGCPRCASLVRARHELVGELAHLSVPDLKEAEGGLRDATVLKALVATWLVDVPHVELERSRLALLDVRDVVQEVGGRATDRIAPEMWSEVAHRLDLADARAAQVHVRELGRRIAHLSHLTWRRVDAVLAGPASVTGPRRPALAPLAPGVALSGGEVVLDRRRPAGRRPAAAAPGGGGGRRARRRPGPADRRPAGPRVRAAADAVAGRGAPAAGPAARLRPRPARRLGDARGDRRAAPGSSPSGSGSGCCRTPRRSTGSPSTGTSSRPASRRRR